MRPPRPIVDGKLYCPVCETWQLPENFRKEKQGRYHCRCAVCEKAYHLAHRLMWRFGITVDEQKKIFEYQGNVCAICGRPPKNQGLSVDHNHKTGLLRGGLCFMCNRILGLIRERIEVLEKAIDYLKNPPAVKALGGERYTAKGRIDNKNFKKFSEQLRKTKTL
jgi:hypothetical protein